MLSPVAPLLLFTKVLSPFTCSPSPKPLTEILDICSHSQQDQKLTSAHTSALEVQVQLDEIEEEERRAEERDGDKGGV